MERRILEIQDPDEFYDYVFNKNNDWLEDPYVNTTGTLKLKLAKTDNPYIKSYIEQYLYLRESPLDGYLSQDYYDQDITNLDVILARNYKSLILNLVYTNNYMNYLLNLDNIRNTSLTKRALNLVSYLIRKEHMSKENLKPYQDAYYDYLHQEAISKIFQEKGNISTFFDLLPNDVKDMIVLEELKDEINKDIKILIYLCQSKKVKQLCTEDAIKRLFEDNSTLGLWYSLWSGYKAVDERNRLIEKQDRLVAEINRLTRKYNSRVEKQKRSSDEERRLIIKEKLSIEKQRDEKQNQLVEIQNQLIETQNQLVEKQNRLVDYFINRPDKPSLHFVYEYDEYSGLVISIFLLPIVKKDYQMVRKLLNYYPDEIKLMNYPYIDDYTYKDDNFQSEDGMENIILFQEIIDFNNTHQITNTTANGILPVLFSIFVNDTGIYKLLIDDLRSNQLTESETDDILNSPLQWAVASGNYEIAKDLLSRGYGPDDVGRIETNLNQIYHLSLPNLPESIYDDDKGLVCRIPPLAIASGLFDTKTNKVSSLEMVKLLVENGADINKAIFGSYQHERTGIIYDYDEEQFKTIYYEDYYGERDDDSNKTSLYVAKMKDNIDIYDYLVSKGGHE